MTVTYTIRAEPGQADALAEALEKLSIPFDANDSLTALPIALTEDNIFTGTDIEELREKANRRLAASGQGPPLREDWWELSLQARYDFLSLMVNEADWEGYRLNHISPQGWAGFMGRHPEAAGTEDQP